ncbi:MAG: hypothetical protein Q9163_003682 [Psora crenata]
MPGREPFFEVLGAEDRFETMGLEIHVFDVDDILQLSNGWQTDAGLGNFSNAEFSDSALSASKPQQSKARQKKLRKVSYRYAKQSSNPPLRPAKDILSRLRHDPSLDQSDYIIGYHDRHEPEVKEMDVSMWKGGGDVTDEEWIPQHRISYFRQKGEEGRHVWNRAKRLDRIFNSGIPERCVEGIGTEQRLGTAKAVDGCSNDGAGNLAAEKGKPPAFQTPHDDD